MPRGSSARSEGIASITPAPSPGRHALGLPARIGSAVDTAPALALAALLALACTIAYYGQFNRKPSGDTYGAVYTAVALVERQTIWLDHYLPYIQARSGEEPYMISSLTRTGQLVSGTPAAPSVQALPAVALFALAGADAGDWNAWMEAAMLTAAITAALSVAVLFVLLTRITTRRRALLSAGVYAFGTLTWTVAGQALWQHSGAMLALAVGASRAPGSQARPGGGCARRDGRIPAICACDRPVPASARGAKTD